MILEDFVMLGKTVPERDRQGRTTVCSAGWSPELRQLVRVYPLAKSGAPADFSVSSVKLERNGRDIRAESWAIGGDRGVSVHENINSRFDVKYILNDTDSLLSTIPRVESIREANSKKLSLAFIKPEHVKFSLERSKNYFRGKEVGSKAYKWVPRLKFKTGDSSHNIKILNQSAYATLNKDSKVGYNYKLPKNPILLIGNMFAYRNNWLVISAW